MKNTFLLLIASILSIGCFATSSAQKRTAIKMPMGESSIAVGDIVPEMTDGKIMLFAIDSASFTCVPGKAIMTAGKKNLELDLIAENTGNMVFSPFSPRDSIDIIVNSPGYKDVKGRIMVKPDQCIIIRMDPTKE